MTTKMAMEEGPIARIEEEDSGDEGVTKRQGSFSTLADPRTSFRTRRNMWDKRATNHTPEGLRPSEASRATGDSTEQEEHQYHYVPTDDPQFNALLQAKKGVDLPSEESRHHKYVPTDDPSFNAMQKKGGKGDYSHLRHHQYVPQIESRRRPPTVREHVPSNENESDAGNADIEYCSPEDSTCEEPERQVISDADAGGGPSFTETVPNEACDGDDTEGQGIDPVAAKSAFRGKVFRPSCKHESFDQTQEYWEEAAKEKTPDGIRPEMAPECGPSIAGDANKIIEEEDLDLKPSPTPPDLDGDETPLAEPIGDEEQEEDDDSLHEYRADDLHAKDELDEVLESLSQDGRGRAALNKEDSASTELSSLQGLSVVGSEMEGDVHTSVSSFEGNSMYLSPPQNGASMPAFTTASLVSREVPVDKLPRDASPLPDPANITNGGPILARSSLRSLVLKRWQPAYWIRAGPSSIYVFRSREDFEDWLLNPVHTQKQRDYLVKVRLDFAEDFNRKSNLRGFRMTALKLKAYDKRGKLYQFKLEKWSDLGVNIAVAFAAQEKKHAEVLRNELTECLANCPNGGLRTIDDLIVQGQR